jgi:activator of HSP90 ATPase
MLQSKWIPKGKFYFAHKNITTGLSFIISIFFMQASLFSQTKSQTMAKPVQDSANEIVIHQEADFKVSPQKLYQTLLSSKAFSSCTKKSFAMFSEKSASIDSVVGGNFSVFDGHIIGKIIELVPDQRIVEAWRVVDWPDGVYSIAKFEFKSKGSGTHLIFEHVGFPVGLKEHLAIGWQQHYWDALNNYFQ